MCSCGCSEGNPMYQFPGPNNTVYVFSYYGGCVDCEAPVGVFVTKYKKSELEIWGLQDLSNAPWVKMGSNDEFALAVLDPNKTIKSINELCGDALVDVDEGFTVKEFLEEVENDEAKRVIMQSSHDTVGLL